MSKLIAMIGATIAGAIGWWVGALVGVMTAVVLSGVATAAGFYFTQRWIATHID